MKARVFVTLKAGVLDPQGQAIQSSLKDLGFADQVSAVRQGKVFEVDLADGLSDEAVKTTLTNVCEKLLANTVIEDFSYEMLTKSPN